MTAPVFPRDKPWLRHYDPQVPEHVLFEAAPLFSLLDEAARRFPRRPAVVFRNWRTDYAGLLARAEVMAANLRRLGVQPGDRVAIMLPNTPQLVVAYWATLKAGAVAVMTNPLYKEHELVRHLGDCQARFLIVLDLLWPRLEALGDRLPVERTVVTRLDDALRFPLNLLYRLKSWREGKRPRPPFDGKRVLPWSALTRGRERYSHQGVRPDRDVAVLQYTGGTTGEPKGAMLTHANLLANVRQCQSILHGLTPGEERFLGVMPFFHIYGLTICVNLGAVLGAALYPMPRFSPQEILAAIDRLRPTIFPGAPAIYVALLHQRDLPRRDLTSIKYCVSGSAPLAQDVMERFRQVTKAAILEGYGLTEASPVTHLNPMLGRRKLGSIGLPFPGTEARIVDLETGRDDLPAGERGELLVRGPQVMLGYWNRPEETARTVQDGWLYTGDVAVMDEEGYFYIVDRKKDLILSGGYNVYPREVEETLYEHPKIKEAVVVGVPHGERGETVKAFIVPKDGERIVRADIVAFCRERLAGYKVPRLVEVREEIPKTMVGKALRRALREEEESRRQTGGAAREEDRP